MIARRLVVSGRVQGVGYRAAMIDVARAIGVSGWVRNRRDGTVEAVMQGDNEQVERMLAW
jgi:acylphosphatase